MNLRVILNFATLTAGECLSKVFTFFAFAYIGRVLEPERYGSIEFALAVMVFFTLPVDFGLGSYGAREIARDRSRAATLLREITLLRGGMALASFALLLLFVLVLPSAGNVKLLIVLYGFGLFGAPALLQWFFQGHERMSAIAAVSVVRQGTFATLIFLFVRRGLPLAWIGVFEVISVAAACGTAVYLLRTRLGGGLPLPRPPAAALLRHFRLAGPIGLAELAWAFLSYFPTVLLGLTLAGNDRGLGWFTASHRMVMALHTFVWLYFFNLLPSISRCVPEPKHRLAHLMHGSLRLIAPAAVLGAALVSALSEWIVRVVYGPAFTGAGPLLAVLVWLIPAAAVSGHYRYALIAYNLQNRLLSITVAGAVVSVLLSLAGVRVAGAMGGAVALVAGHMVILVLAWHAVRQRVTAVSWFAGISREELGDAY